ncbi:hypothetical protein PInf_006700 [Phytophthora infestans]|nr:hypothetical protein PInf_006700 [Phytophthora infestans]
MTWITRTACLTLLLVLSVRTRWCEGVDIMDMLAPFINLTELAEQAAKDTEEGGAAVKVVDRTYPLASVELDALMQMYRDCRTKESAALRTWCIGDGGDSYLYHEAVYFVRTEALQMMMPSSCGHGKDFGATRSLSRPHYLPGESLHCEIAKLDLSIMVSLEQLDLSSNQLFGDVPDWLKDMTTLRILNLAKNQLTGDIPTSIAGNDALEQINLSSNNLTASSLSFFDAFRRLQHLDISNNSIDLQLPRSVFASRFLRSMYVCVAVVVAVTYLVHPLTFASNISHNAFHGVLPELPAFHFLESLDMSSNFLTGVIPPQLSLWGREDPHDPDENSSLAFVDMSNNMLTGDLPRISNQSALQRFNIHNNFLGGLVPELPLSLLELAKPADFDGNQLLCPMPAALVSSNLTCVCGDGYTVKLAGATVNTSSLENSDARGDWKHMVLATSHPAWALHIVRWLYLGRSSSRKVRFEQNCVNRTTLPLGMGRPGEVYDHVEWPRLALDLTGVDLVDTASDRESPFDVLIQAWTDTLTSFLGSRRPLHVLQVRPLSSSAQMTQIVVAVETISPVSTTAQAGNNRAKEVGDAVHQAAKAAQSALDDLLDELEGSSAGRGNQESDDDHLADLIHSSSFRDALVRQFGRANLFDGALSFSMVNVSMVEPPFTSTRAVACPPGTFFSVIDNERVCLPCVIGSYSRSSGALQCDPCPRRTFSSEKGLDKCKPCPLGSDAPSGASSCVDCSWFTYECEGFWKDLIVAVCVGAALLRRLYQKIQKLCAGDQAAQQQDESVALMTAVRTHGRTFDGVRYAPMGMVSADAMFGCISDT